MTPGMTDRSPGLSLVDTEWRRWERLVAQLRVEDYMVPVFEAEGAADSWTIRDVLAHIAAWKRNTIRVAEVHAAGGSPPLDETPDETLQVDVKAFNDEVYRRWHAASVPDIVAEHQAAHRELVAVLGRLPIAKIPSHPTRTWLYPATWHPRLHRLHVLDALDPL
ncbi:hypothetical protein BH18CHL2_BH18CHL2_06790 [soil metagenome]